MPVERIGWTPTPDLGTLNQRLRRALEVLDASHRYDAQSFTVTGTLSLTFPRTLVLVDTTAGSVTLTLPPARTVAGYRIEVKKMIAANTLTLDGAGAETIDGSTTLAWTTQYLTNAIISNGSAWYRA